MYEQNRTFPYSRTLNRTGYCMQTQNMRLVGDSAHEAHGRELNSYVNRHVQRIRTVRTVKPIKQKMLEIMQVNVPIVFYFAEIIQTTKLGPKKRFCKGPKIKIKPSGSHPIIHLLFVQS